MSSKLKDPALLTQVAEYLTEKEKNKDDIKSQFVVFCVMGKFNLTKKDATKLIEEWANMRPKFLTE